MASRLYHLLQRVTAPLRRRLEKKVGKHVIREAVSAHANTDLFTLDIGCGKRLYREHFSNMVGMDIENHGGAQVIGDAHYIPFEQNAFDLIICSEVIEHLKEPTLAVEEMSRVLKPDGGLIATIPFVYPVHEAPNDYQRYTEYGLKLLLGRRFRINDIQPLYSEEQTLAILIQRISFQRKDSLLRYYTYLALAHMIFKSSRNRRADRFQDLGRTVPGSFLTADYLVLAQNIRS